MKSFTATALITVFLGSCGDGNSDLAVNSADAKFPLIDSTVPANPSNDEGAQFVALSELIGQVAISYSFAGEEPV